MKGQLFEYAILYHPKPSKDQADRNETPKSELLIKPTTILAMDAGQVGTLAARVIPDEHVSHLEDIEIVVRPFAEPSV